MGDWIKASEQLPTEETVVETKIDDGKGCRNVQKLKRRGRLWFLPVGSMYVYYTPTHWRWLHSGLSFSVSPKIKRQ